MSERKSEIARQRTQLQNSAKHFSVKFWHKKDKRKIIQVQRTRRKTSQLQKTFAQIRIIDPSYNSKMKICPVEEEQGGMIIKIMKDENSLDFIANVPKNVLSKISDYQNKPIFAGKLKNIEKLVDLMMPICIHHTNNKGVSNCHKKFELFNFKYSPTFLFCKEDKLKDCLSQYNQRIKEENPPFLCCFFGKS